MSITENGTQCLNRAKAFEARFLDVEGKSFQDATNRQTADYIVDCHTLFKEVTDKASNSGWDLQIAQLPTFVSEADYRASKNTERALTDYYGRDCILHGHAPWTSIAEHPSVQAQSTVSAGQEGSNGAKQESEATEVDGLGESWHFEDDPINKGEGTGPRAEHVEPEDKETVNTDAFGENGVPVGF